MKIIKNIREMQVLSERVKRKGQTIGFVPTMGALHAGHLSLVKEARKSANFVVVSIFVNPSQFGPKEDFKKYPKSLKHDVDLLSGLKIDAVFYPQVTDIYPQGYSTSVNVDILSDKLCSKARPGHFQAVSTIVLKLFNIINPDMAFFGKKDFQQQIIIKRMVKDLNLSIKIVALPIMREPDGLAMSSRNSYMNDKDRNDAAVLYRALQFARILIRSGERKSKKIKPAMRKMINKVISADIEYISICDTETLNEISVVESEVLIALAVKIGETRLIDNIVISPRR